MSKNTYKDMLESAGINSDNLWKVNDSIERAHEIFSLLSDEHRLILQEMWGIKFITELETFGNYTNRQSSLVQAPDIQSATKTKFCTLCNDNHKGWEMGNGIPFRELTDREEKEFRNHARGEYIVGSPINEVWHPHYRDECKRMNDEL